MSSDDVFTPSWEFSDKKFSKTVVAKGYGFCSPQDGSVCKIKVLFDETNILNVQNEEKVKEIIVGDVDDPIERILESCLRTMKNEEICDLRFPDPFYVAPVSNNNTISDCTEITAENCGSHILNIPEEAENCTESEKASDDQEQPKTDNVLETPSSPSNSKDLPVKSDQPVEDKMDNIEDCKSLQLTTPTIYNVQLQLLAYTREPEIHEMSITEKWRRANYHKQKGMELYARGFYEWAFRRFGLSLKYIISLEHDLPSGQEEGMNIAGLKLSCFLNVAACQMRHHNYKAVVQNCTKALQLQPDNPKALYRRGSAFLQLQDYEKSKEDLEKAQELEPKNQAILKQQQLLKAQVKKLNQYYANAMKKMFT